MRGDLARLDGRIVTALRRADQKLYRSGLCLVVVSGYRDPLRQAALQAAWDRGERSGLTGRPATVSKHTQGRAVDVSFAWRGLPPMPAKKTPPEWFLWLARFTQMQWGGYPTNHFEID